MKIAIINYGMGNLRSVVNSCQKVGFDAAVVSDAHGLKNYDKLILPGVGAFPDAMKHLRETGMFEALKELGASKQLLGICLGMQLLFERGFEHHECEGLGLLSGDVVRFDASKMSKHEKVPQMGWNKLFFKKNSPILDGVENEAYLYFVHSYHVVTDEANVLCSSHYGYEFASAVARDNIFGFQPHPEKSGEVGLKILKNFLEMR
jgi:imidazole glycerol-phosphate synthase subunit HisH